jgi:hypothetical protein
MSMELLLKREQGGGEYQLFAKFEFKPEEQAIINKSMLRQAIIWQDPIGDSKIKSQGRIRGCLALIVCATFLMYLISYLDGKPEEIHLGMWIVDAFVALPVWLVVSIWFFRRYRERLSVSDLLKGRTIRGDEETLRFKEEEIRKAAQKINQHIQGWQAGGEWGGSGERIAL